MREVYLETEIRASLVLLFCERLVQSALTGKLGQLSDLDGLYLWLDGIAAVLSATATPAFARANPFPRLKRTYG